jgi:hypothetical protein
MTSWPCICVLWHMPAYTLNGKVSETIIRCETPPDHYDCQGSAVDMSPKPGHSSVSFPRRIPNIVASGTLPWTSNHGHSTFARFKLPMARYFTPFETCGHPIICQWWERRLCVHKCRPLITWVLQTARTCNLYWSRSTTYKIPRTHYCIMAVTRDQEVPEFRLFYVSRTFYADYLPEICSTNI